MFGKRWTWYLGWYYNQSSIYKTCGDKTVFWSKQHHQSLFQGGSVPGIKDLCVKVQVQPPQAGGLILTGWPSEELWSHLIVRCLCTDISIVFSWSSIISPYPSHPLTSPAPDQTPGQWWMETDYTQPSPPCPAWVLWSVSWLLSPNPYSQISQSP